MRSESKAFESRLSEGTICATHYPTHTEERSLSPQNLSDEAAKVMYQMKRVSSTYSNITPEVQKQNLNKTKQKALTEGM